MATGRLPKLRTWCAGRQLVREAANIRAETDVFAPVVRVAAALWVIASAVRRARLSALRHCERRNRVGGLSRLSSLPALTRRGPANLSRLTRATSTLVELPLRAVDRVASGSGDCGRECGRLEWAVRALRRCFRLRLGLRGRFCLVVRKHVVWCCCVS